MEYSLQMILEMPSNSALLNELASVQTMLGWVIVLVGIGTWLIGGGGFRYAHLLPDTTEVSTPPDRHNPDRCTS